MAKCLMVNDQGRLVEVEVPVARLSLTDFPESGLLLGLCDIAQFSQEPDRGVLVDLRLNGSAKVQYGVFDFVRHCADCDIESSVKLVDVVEVRPSVLVNKQTLVNLPAGLAIRHGACTGCYEPAFLLIESGETRCSCPDRLA